MSHEDFDDFLFVKHRMVSIDEEGDEEGIFKKISKFEEGEAPRIINTYQDTKRESRLEGNTRNLTLILIGGCTIYSEDVVELRSISIAVVEYNDPLEENIPSVGAPVNEGDLYDRQVCGYYGIYTRKASNHHRYCPKLPSVRTSIITNLPL